MLYICTTINVVSLPGVDWGERKVGAKSVVFPKGWARHSMGHAAQARVAPFTSILSKLTSKFIQDLQYKHQTQLCGLLITYGLC